MSSVNLIKMHGGILRPADQESADTLERIKTGAYLVGDIRQPRNPRFHRKLFALLNFTFDYWEPNPIEGVEAGKDFERFRKDILILAGFRHVVVNIKGEPRYEAESISFAKMDETRFNEVYRQVFAVCWRLVLSGVHGMTEEAAENAINQILSYD